MRFKRQTMGTTFPFWNLQNRSEASSIPGVMIKSNTHHRQGAAVTNFDTQLPQTHAQLAYDRGQRLMKDCPFCYDNIKDRVVAEQNSVVAIQDNYPVADGHLLIVPKRHIEDYFSLNETEKRDTDVLIMKLKDRITENDHSVTGFNIGTNVGESAGQTIFHAHIHLIPRRNNDTPHPRGGVRGVIPEKMSY